MIPDRIKNIKQSAIGNNWDILFIIILGGLLLLMFVFTLESEVYPNANNNNVKREHLINTIK